MLQLMQEAGGFPAASLLSHGSAQGSSNLIYILKSLQVRRSLETTTPQMPAHQAQTGFSLDCTHISEANLSKQGSPVSGNHMSFSC